MKQIILQKLVITNFKGITNLTVDFNPITNIYGANGSGKTSIFDAFTWLLFGKDSSEKKDFDIKPLDISGSPIQKIENEVEGTILSNGEEIVLKRIHREKWVKKKGSPEPEFTGNETVYFWNDVPMKSGDYTAKISELVDESIFKLISNPFAFNNLKWQDRRNVLIDIAGEINVDYASHGLEHILQLTEKKTIEELKKEVSAKVKKIKEELKQIPTRIDEVSKSKPDPLQFEGLEKELIEKENLLKELDLKLQDYSNNNQALIEKKTKIQNEIFELKTNVSNIEFELKNEATNSTKVDTSKIDSLNKKISDLKDDLKTSKSRISNLELGKESDIKKLQDTKNEMKAKRVEWQSVNAQTLTFNEEDFHCPACKREFESGDVDSKKEELTTNFNNNKKDKLNSISLKGKSLKEDSERLDASIDAITKQIQKGNDYCDSLESTIAAVESEIKEINTSKENSSTKTFEQVYTELLVSHPEYGSTKELIKEKEDELASIVITPNTELSQQKQTVQSEIKEINTKLSSKSQIESANKRIKELEQEESNLSTSLLELEKQEFDVEKYIKLNIEALESSINEKFKIVRFKMFETQINGGEAECCNALINGVPFHSANTASKVNAGIDIINTLCGFYTVNAPIFIDNRESVTTLTDTSSQIINLIVSSENKQLLIA